MHPVAPLMKSPIPCLFLRDQFRASVFRARVSGEVLSVAKRAMEEPDDGRESATELYNIASTMGTTYGADGLEPLHPTTNTPNPHDRDTCAANLKLRSVMKPKRHRAARGRPGMNTNRLGHREHRLERAATSSWLEELEDQRGAQPAAPASQGSMRSPTAWS